VLIHLIVIAIMASIIRRIKIVNKIFKNKGSTGLEGYKAV